MPKLTKQGFELAAEVVAAQVVADFAARRIVANRRKAAEYRKSLIERGILLPTGKSFAVKQIAHELGYKVIDVRI